MPLESCRIKLTVAYDGSGFHGFQRQEGRRTVQSELERALEELFGRRIETFGASRTDAGVHALGQVIHFTVESPLPAERAARAVRSHLPRDIVAVESEAVPDDFHARFSAVGKRYLYVIDRSPAPMPFLRHAATALQGAPDVSRMSGSLKYFLGEHDFSAFRNEGSQPSNPVRAIHEFTLEEHGLFLMFRVRGSSFLYRMVRNLVGTVVEVGRGRMSPESIPEIIAAKDRSRAGPTMPPQGLYLAGVEYDK